MLSETLRAASFANLRQQREIALAQERAHDERHLGEGHDYATAEDAAEGDRLADVRDVIEEALMTTPSPDAAAFAYKYLVAFGDGREADQWEDIIEAEARRFSSTAADCPATDTAALFAAMDDIDVQSKRVKVGVTDDEAFGWMDAQDAVLEQVCALPSTPENLAIRARAIGCAVDNTSDLATLDLHELCAHLPERGVAGGDGPTGLLILQILACCIGDLA